MKSAKTLIVIPYLASAAQGKELALAIAGWKRHFMAWNEIIVVGDFDGAVAQEDVTFLECPRIEGEPGQYLPHLDHRNKFLRVLDTYPNCDGFIYACDDMFAVQDFTLADVRRPKVMGEIPKIDWLSQSRWWRDQGKTREECIRHGWPTKDWVCHLPVYFSRERLEAILARSGSYVWENLYFNSWLYDMEGSGGICPFETVTERCRWKYNMLLPDECPARTDDAHAVWISCANSGWSPQLEAILSKHYGL